MIVIGISDVIELFLLDALEKGGGLLEIQRRLLSEKFNCVPSQINYVIATRFTNERGFCVESRRGGGGYIKIRRVSSDGIREIMHIVNAIGKTIDSASACAILQNMAHNQQLTQREANIIMAAVSDTALPQNGSRSQLRATLLKNMLISTLL